MLLNEREIAFLTKVGQDQRQGGHPKNEGDEATRAGLRSLIVAHIRKHGENERKIAEQIATVTGWADVKHAS
jgi:hypothetical protein